MRTTLVTIALVASLGGVSWCGELTEEQILGEADARIERYRKGDAVLKLIDLDGTPIATGTSVSIVQTRHKFLFGANIYKFDDCRTPEQNAAYQQRFRELLNFATVRFYWVSYEIEEGKLEFADRLKIARWCLEHGITPKGHPLFWSECQPEWLHQKDPAEAESLAWSRIGREISAFRDEIQIWDVLNEPTKGVQHARELNAVTALRIYERYGTVERRLIKGKWWTRTEVSVGAGGQARFRGFLGEYEVSAALDGRKVTGRFQVDSTAKEPLAVQLK